MGHNGLSIEAITSFALSTQINQNRYKEQFTTLLKLEWTCKIWKIASGISLIHHLSSTEPNQPQSTPSYQRLTTRITNRNISEREEIKNQNCQRTFPANFIFLILKCMSNLNISIFILALYLNV